MKKVHARICVSVEVTEKEFEEIKKLATEDEMFYNDIDENQFPDWLKERFKTEGNMFDGDTYIPGDWVEYTVNNIWD